jgi:alkaline phosphatase D
MKKAFLYVLLVALCLPTPDHVKAQSLTRIVSGPMLGHVDYRHATVWVQLSNNPQATKLRFWKKGANKVGSIALARPSTDATAQGYDIVHFRLNDLDVNTTYEYQLMNGDVVIPGSQGSFTTKDLWQWRKPAPDFSFLTGSCSYMNQPQYDRPGRAYGGDSSIYETMAREDAAFMLWLGDNWYTREVDYYSTWGLWYRAAYDRSRPVMQSFLKKMPHYAIWDDHDFGPNDIGREFVLKEESRKVFSGFWANPSCGEDGMGIYTKLSHGDVDFFLLDDRTWRSSDRLSDSVNGQPNPLKKMFGEMQIEWLKNALAGSSATFKVIATGSQVLNPRSPFDCFRKFPAEYLELMAFLREEKISGVVFLTGDRHHSEVIRVEGLTSYPLYDITVSPLTSGTHQFSGPEKDNPYRVFGLDQKQNYGKISVSGKVKDRRLSVSFIGVKGEKLGEWSVHENELK